MQIISASNLEKPFTDITNAIKNKLFYFWWKITGIGTHGAGNNFN